MTTAEVMHPSQIGTDTEKSTEWESVTSSQLSAIKYLPETETLFIRFSTGAIYQYQIPPDVVNALRKSNSKGSFFGKEIKNSYRGKLISPPTPLAEIVSPEPVKIEMTKLEAEALTLIDQANALVVSTKEEAENALAFVRHRKSILSAFVEWFAPIKKASWDAHKKNTEKEKSIVDPNEKAISIVNAKILAFDEEQKRLARLEAERIRKEEEEKERKRREKEEEDRKERQRIEDEARAKEEARIKAEREVLEAEKKAQADALAKAGMEAEAERIRKAAAAQAELDALMAENRRIKEENDRLEEERRAKEALEAPIYIPEPVVIEEKIEGLVIPKAWKAEVIDIRALCRGIADGKTPPDVISINQAKLNALAKTWKERTGDHHPGVRAYEDRSVRT